MRPARKADNIFMGLILFLLLAGFLMLASASFSVSAYRFGQPYYYFLHQLLFGLLPGVFLFYFAFRTHYDFWRKWALPLIILAFFLSFLVFVPNVGFYHGGARRWISLGSFSFQPSEFLKFAYVVYLSAWLESKSKAVASFKFGFLPFLIMSGFIASFLIMQPDIGTLAVLILSIAVLFFVSGGNFKQMLLLAIVTAAIIGVLIIAEPYRLNRIRVFVNPELDPQGIGYQTSQALIAVGSGGFWGRGLGLSRQKFSYLPEPIGDSVFAIAAEEAGFIGSAAIVGLFLLIFFRGIWISMHSADTFGKYLSSGLIFLIVFQALTNIAAIIGLFPLTGITLSFVSYGGSALAINLAEAGIILNISKYRG